MKLEEHPTVNRPVAELYHLSALCHNHWIPIAETAGAWAGADDVGFVDIKSEASRPDRNNS